MFDCHAHLTDAAFGEGLDEALAQAEAVGVIGIITVSESLEDAGKVFALYSNLNGFVPSNRRAYAHFTHAWL